MDQQEFYYQQLQAALDLLFSDPGDENGNLTQETRQAIERIQQMRPEDFTGDVGGAGNEPDFRQPQQPQQPQQHARQDAWAYPQQVFIIGDRQTAQQYLAGDSPLRYEWVHDPGPRSQNRWRNTETGEIEYSEKKPGKGKSKDEDRSKRDLLRDIRKSQDTGKSSKRDLADALGSSFDPALKKSLARRTGSAVWGLIRIAGHKIAHIEHVITDFLANRVDEHIERLPDRIRKPVASSWFLTKLGTKVAFASYVASWRLAQEVAREKGATPEQTQRLLRILTAVDSVGAKAVPLTLGWIGLGGLGFGASFVPAGTTAYLAYSTVRNPVAVLGAARKHVLQVIRRKQGELPIPAIQEGDKAVQHALEGDPLRYGRILPDHTASQGAKEDVILLYDRMVEHEQAGDFEWWWALLHAALDESQTLREAMEIAEEAAEESRGSAQV